MLRAIPWDFWLIFLLLAVLLPWRGRVRVQRLLAKPQTSITERVLLYVQTIVFQWLLTVLVGWRAFARGFTVKDLALVHRGSATMLISMIVGAILIGVFHWFNLRRVSKRDSDSDLIRRPRALAERIFPQTNVEILPYAALALTAGVCEEFIYRGFVMAVLSHVGFPAWSVVLLSSVLFGLAHLYQGGSGFVGTLLIGIVFAIARMAYNSLLPVALWHTTFDIVAGIAGAKYLVRHDHPT